ncbi:MAG: HEAT repeat domain-containing protein [Halobacteriaceae archaeon]
MSDDDSDADPEEAPAADEGEAADADEEATALSPDSLDSRLDDAAEALSAAETEADLDEVEATLDDIEADIEAADLPEPEDEDDEDPGADLEDRLSELRADLDEQRGPYAEDVTDEVASAGSTIESTRWTETGVEDLHDAVSEFVDAASDALGEDIDVEVAEDTDSYVAALDAAAEAIEGAALDPDDDADTVGELVDAADALAAGVEDAQEWDDLSVRQKLRAEGFYDVLEGRKHKDFPPEWSALKEWEKRDDVEMVLLCLEHLESDFMERHCIEALERMGNPECVDAMLERAERRDKDAIRVIGKTGHASGEVLSTLHEFVDGDPGLQLVVLKALGELGSEESTQPVADQLEADDARVRSRAARALGLIGDPRAVAPLGEVLGDAEEAENVRASAAWALVRIGTREALETAAEYADDRSYVVQQEAEPAAEALDAPAA